MKITKENVGEVLQRIYDSGIDIAIAWLWDGGLDYSIENKICPLGEAYEKIESTDERDIVKGIEKLCLDIVQKFPKSTFTKWFKSK